MKSVTLSLIAILTCCTLIVGLSFIDYLPSDSGFAQGTLQFADAHRSDIYAGNYTAVSPTIDGEFGAAEWKSATTLATTFGVAYLMNDDSNLYFGAAIMDGMLQGRTLEVFFDNSHNGRLDLGDDVLAFRQGFSDESIDFIAPGTFGYGPHEEVDGMAAASTDSGYSYYEFSHPLCTQDNGHDFCLSAGKVVGFNLRYVRDGQGTDWPEPLSIDAYSWGDIVIANSLGIAEEVPPPAPSEICGDKNDNDFDGQIDEADMPPQPKVNWGSCVFLNANLTGVDLHDSNLQFATLTNANLTGANLQNASMVGVNLVGADLGGADLQGADLNGADLQGANLGGASLRFAKLHSSALHSANLAGADLYGAVLKEATLSGANLTGINLEKADLRGAYLSGLDLRLVELLDAEFALADLSETNLEGVNLSYHNLTETALVSSNLHGANLVASILTRANFDAADLSDSDLHLANTRFAYFEGSDLTGTVRDGPVTPWFTGTNLKYGDYFVYQLCSAKHDCKHYEMTIWINTISERYWGADVSFRDDNGIRVLNDVKIDRNSGDLIREQPDNIELVNAYRYLSFFSAFSNQSTPRDFDSTTWFPLTTRSTSPMKIISSESTTVGNSIFDTVARADYAGNVKYWLVKDLPFPIKGIYASQVDGAEQTFQFELLEYGSASVSPISRSGFGPSETLIAVVATAAGVGLILLFVLRKRRT